MIFLKNCRETGFFLLMRTLKVERGPRVPITVGLNPFKIIEQIGCTQLKLYAINTLTLLESFYRLWVVHVT